MILSVFACFVVAHLLTCFCPLSRTMQQVYLVQYPAAGAREWKLIFFFELHCGIIIVVLCIELLQSRSLPCLCICLFRQGEKNATTALGMGLFWMCDITASLLI